MSRRTRRSVDIFNLSFLDVVSCGFGAIILLLVIVKIAEPRVIEKLAVDLSGLVHRLQTARSGQAEEKARVSAELETVRQQLEQSRTRLAGLDSDVAALRAQAAKAQLALESAQRIESRLETAKQALSEEMRRLLGRDNRRLGSVIGGIPVDSEYIVFIVDTSGSMRKGAWPQVLKKVSEVLDIYPHVKGIQVMNDMGDYMFTQYAGRWIPDTPARRQSIVRRLSGWEPFSNSSPVEGIEAAIKRFYAGDKRISLYVFGDDFARGSIQRVLDTVASLNRADSSGRRRVRIHAVGFPVQFEQGGLPVNSIRFAALMRRLAEENGGSFVGLTR